MGEWKELSGDRLIRDMGKYSLIIPKSKIARVPIDCPVCRQLMSTHEDSISYHDFLCCSLCELEWAYPNKDRWLAGWRPDPGAIQNELEKRNKSPMFSYNVK